MQCLRHEINIQITLSNRSMSIKTIPWSTEFFHFSYIANKQWHSKTFSKTTLGLWEARISEHGYLFILFQMNLGGDSNNAKWDKVFKNGPSKICGRQPLKKLNGYDLLKQTKADHNPSTFLKAVFHKFYLVHSWILCPK